jgi:hypothetical protein
MSGRAGIARHGPDGVVGHVADPVDPGHRKIVQHLLAWIADGDGVIEKQRHAGQVLRDHAGADDEQVLLRSVHMAQELTVFIPAQRLVAIHLRHRSLLTDQIHGSLDVAALVEALAERVDVGAGVRIRLQRLDDDPQRSAAG